MQFIDVSTWERAAHYEVFRNSAQPQYCVTFDVDVTNFLAYVKKRNYSFTFSFVYAVTKCANEIEAFRCRFPYRCTIPLWTAYISGSLQKSCSAI